MRNLFCDEKVAEQIVGNKIKMKLIMTIDKMFLTNFRVDLKVYRFVGKAKRHTK